MTLWNITLPVTRRKLSVEAEGRDEAALLYAERRYPAVQRVTPEANGWYSVTRMVYGESTTFPRQFRVWQTPVKEDRGVDEVNAQRSVAAHLSEQYGPGWSVTELEITTQFRSDARADLLYLPDNGTSIGVEIKTQRDSLTRLSRQVPVYEDNFTRNYLATTPNHVAKAVLVLPAYWGIIILDPETHEFLEVMRSPDPETENEVLRPPVIFGAVWAEEWKAELRARKIPFGSRWSKKRMREWLMQKVSEDVILCSIMERMSKRTGNGRQRVERHG